MHKWGRLIRTKGDALVCTRKKIGKIPIPANRRDRKADKKAKQRVIATLGRLDRLQEKGRVEALIRSLSRFSEQALLILSGQSDVSAEARKIGPSIIFERLWEQTGIQGAIQRLVAERNFEFDVERAIFLTVLHRLMVSGSDRALTLSHIRGVTINGTKNYSKLFYGGLSLGFLPYMHAAAC